MAMAVRNEGDKINSNINVTPMVDVMLVLLIIFMVITPMITPGYKIRLPKANNPLQMPEADKEDALLVAVNREGRVFFGNDQIDPADLTTRVKERLATAQDQRVFVKADARVHYKAVVEVVEDVRSAGVSELGLLTERKWNSP
jgi:biopolymer transport protein ExbD/biopolymer transport protein TolR